MTFRAAVTKPKVSYIMKAQFKQTDSQANKQKDKQAERQTDKLAYRQTGGQKMDMHNKLLWTCRPIKDIKDISAEEGSARETERQTFH